MINYIVNNHHHYPSQRYSIHNTDHAACTLDSNISKQSIAVGLIIASDGVTCSVQHSPIYSKY